MSVEGGNLVAMSCESRGCIKGATCDCKRKKPPIWIRPILYIAGYRQSDWANEPIALCEEHSQGRKILRRFKAGENTGTPLGMIK